MLVDTHAHLSDERLAGELPRWLQAARQAGVTRIINVGADVETSRLAVQQAEAHAGVYAAVGLHPHDAKKWDAAAAAELTRMTQHRCVVAYGEIGLDYYYDFSPRDLQQEVFRAQLALAKERRLPVIIHDREAHQDALAILKSEGPYPAGGVMHCYSGSEQLLAEYLDLGFYISFAGPVTFKNAKRPLAAAQQVPLDRLLVETDCPYLTPEPYRGRLNHPAHVYWVAKKLQSCAV